MCCDPDRPLRLPLSDTAAAWRDVRAATGRAQHFMMS
jgi:hypothetical protein